MTISLKTGQLNVWYFNLYSFSRHSDSSVTQHLAALNKILFTKGGFSGIKYTKIVFVFGRALLRARYPAGGATTLLQASPPQSTGDGDAFFPFPSPLQAFGLSMSGPMTTWQPHSHTTTSQVVESLQNTPPRHLMSPCCHVSMSYSN